MHLKKTVSLLVNDIVLLNSPDSAFSDILIVLVEIMTPPAEGQKKTLAGATPKEQNCSGRYAGHM